MKLYIWVILSEQCSMTALDIANELFRLIRYIPVLRQRSALIIGVLFLYTTALCLSMIAMLLSSHNQLIKNRVTFLPGHIWAILYSLDITSKFKSSPDISGIIYSLFDNKIGTGLLIIDLHLIEKLDNLKWSEAIESRKAIDKST